MWVESMASNVDYPGLMPFGVTVDSDPETEASRLNYLAERGADVAEERIVRAAGEAAYNAAWFTATTEGMDPSRAREIAAAARAAVWVWQGR